MNFFLNLSFFIISIHMHISFGTHKCLFLLKESSPFRFKGLFTNNAHLVLTNTSTMCAARVSFSYNFLTFDDNNTDLFPHLNCSWVTLPKYGALFCQSIVSIQINATIRHFYHNVYMNWIQLRCNGSFFFKFNVYFLVLAVGCWRLTVNVIVYWIQLPALLTIISIWPENWRTKVRTY